MGKQTNHAGADKRGARRQQFQQQPGTRQIITPMRLMSVLTAILAVSMIYVIGFSGSRADAGPRAVGGPGQDVSLPVAQFDDGIARFYTHTTASGREVRFFVMKSSDGVIRAAFDACDTCYEARRGYQQRGDVMVCRNCNQTFASKDINVLQGGCNPAPIQRSVVGDRVVLSASALSAGIGYF